MTCKEEEINQIPPQESNDDGSVESPLLKAVTTTKTMKNLSEREGSNDDSSSDDDDDLKMEWNVKQDHSDSSLNGGEQKVVVVIAQHDWKEDYAVEETAKSLGDTSRAEKIVTVDDVKSPVQKGSVPLVIAEKVRPSIVPPLQLPTKYASESSSPLPEPSSSYSTPTTGSPKSSPLKTEPISQPSNPIRRNHSVLHKTESMDRMKNKFGGSSINIFTGQKTPREVNKLSITSSDNKKKKPSTPSPLTKRSETGPTPVGSNFFQAQLEPSSALHGGDLTERRITFVASDIIKAFFEGDVDESPLLDEGDISDYLTKIVKQHFDSEELSKASIFNSPPASTIATPRKFEKTTPNSTPSGKKHVHKKSKSVVTLERGNIRETALSDTAVLEQVTTPRHRRKVTAIGSGMIPHNFNTINPESELKSARQVSSSMSDARSSIHGSKISNIALNLTQHYTNATGVAPSKLMSADNIYRVTVLGSVGCGKSSIIKRFIKGEFKESYTTTQFEDIYHKPLMLLEYQEIKLLEVLDTSAIHIRHYKNKVTQNTLQVNSEEKDLPSPRIEIPSSFLSDYIIKCDAYVLVFSVDDVESYTYCKNIYKSLVEEKKKLSMGRPVSIPIVLAGNKSDLGEEERFVNPTDVTEDVNNLVFGANCTFVETSAKTESVDCIFEILVKRICFREKPQQERPSPTIIRTKSMIIHEKKVTPHGAIASSQEMAHRNKKCVIL